MGKSKGRKRKSRGSECKESIRREKKGRRKEKAPGRARGCKKKRRDADKK
jgi:hypothetical protein